MTKRILTTLLTLMLTTTALALELELHILNVGQGTGLLVKAPTGQTALIDAGPSRDTAVQQLQQLGVEHLNLAIATHQDADHIGAMSDIIMSFPPQFYMDNGITHTTQTYTRTLDAVLTSGAQLLEATHRNINLGGVTLTILPPPGDPNLGQNDNSVGVLITYGNFRAFAPGDAEATQWHWWLQHYSDFLAGVDVLIASHHGSRNGDTRAGVNHLRPSVTIISSGADNTYGHPHAEALNLYASVNSQVLRTDELGTITLRITPDGAMQAFVYNH